VRPASPLRHAVTMPSLAPVLFNRRVCTLSLRQPSSAPKSRDVVVGATCTSLISTVIWSSLKQPVSVSVTRNV
jgi:hypothetical protein